MTLPLSVKIYDKAFGGAPTFNNPVDLRGRITEYEHAIADRCGYETMRCGWNAGLKEAGEWLRMDHLMRPVRVYSPQARRVWEGVLFEIRVTIGNKPLVLSLKDMANRLLVRSSNSDGTQPPSSTYSNVTSIAMFGTKDRKLNLSTTAATAGDNRAQTALNEIAFPRSKQASSVGTGKGSGIKIELSCIGRYALLDWLLTTSTSTTSTVTHTQVLSLLGAYNATNNQFSSSAVNVTATGVSDTEWIDPDSTYRQKIEGLLCQGNASHQRMSWGIYNDGVLTLVVWAGATPNAITYTESARTGEVRDAYDNIVMPWDLRPNAMARVTDLTDTPVSGAIDSASRKFVARVTCRIANGEIKGTLEPDNSDSLDAMLAGSSGRGPAATSDQQAALDRSIVTAARTTFAPTDNGGYNRNVGVWNPIAGGTGVRNAGTITVPHNIDLGTGAGIGGTGKSGVSTSGGTPGAMVKWLTSSALTDAVSGTDYAAASHTHAAADVVSGTFATARLGSGTADATTFLRGDSTWQAISGVSGAPADATYIVQTSNTTLTNEQALGALATGILKSTTTTGVLSIAVAGVDYAAAAHTHPASDIVSGILATARLGSGTASSTTFLRGDSTWQAISTITPPDIGAAPNDAKYIVQEANSGLSAEQSLGTLTTGLLKNTVTSGVGVLSTATASDLPNHASRHADGGADEVSLDTSQLTTGTMATARLGSGTADATTFLRGDSTWQSVSSGSSAPVDATYIVQTSNSTLTNEQALGALATGILKNTTTTGVLSIAVAGTDYAAASHTHAAADVVSGTLATARLGRGTANSSAFLRGDSSWQPISSITPSDISAAPIGAKYIVQTADATLTNEQALGALATGIVKNTTTTGVLSIAVANTDYAAATHASRHANGGADEVSLDAGQTTSGTFATARLGSGTASATTILHGDSSWSAIGLGSAEVSGTLPGVRGGTGVSNSGKTITLAGNLTTSGGGDVTLSAGANYTLTLPQTGTAVVRTTAGTANRVAFFNGQYTLTDNTIFTLDVSATPPTLTYGGTITGTALVSTGAIRTAGNVDRRLGAFTTQSGGTIIGYVSDTVAGVVRKLAVIS